VDDIRRSFQKRHRSVLAVLPTGGGKTAIGAYIANRVEHKGYVDRRGYKVWFLVHRDFLVRQTLQAFRRAGIVKSEYAVLAAGAPAPADPHRLHMVCSLPTLARRLERLERFPYMVIIDEAHHGVAVSWRRVLERARSEGSLILGLTATPERLDGKGLEDAFDDMVAGPSTGQLIETGHLARYRAWTINIGVDRARMRTTAGDFNRRDMEAQFEDGRIMARVVDNVERHCRGRRTLLYCASVEKARRVAEEIGRRLGWPAWAVDARTPMAERAEVEERFARTPGSVIVNCEIYTEGYDCSAADAIVMARPTKSLSLHLQMMGRGLRPGPDKVCKIIDLVGNIGGLGTALPDSDYRWSLEGRPRKGAEREPPVKECPECGAICHLALQACRECGYVFPPPLIEAEADLVPVETGLRLMPPEVDALIASRLEFRPAPYSDKPKPASVDRLAYHLKEVPGGLARLAETLEYKPGWCRHMQRKMSGKTLKQFLEDRVQERSEYGRAQQGK